MNHPRRRPSSRRFPCRVVGFGLAATVVLFTLLRSAGLADDFESKVADLEKQRRELATRELTELRARRETLEARVNYAKKVVLNSFHLSEQGLIPQPSKTVKTFQKQKQLRETTAHGLLEHRESFRGDIVSGKALNFFLKECGPAAFEHSFYRKNLQSSSTLPEEQQLFREITDNYKLSKQTTRHIIWSQGLVGPKLSGRLNQLPLDTRWPNILRTKVFQPLTTKIEKLRDQAVDELQAGKPVAPKTADDLLDAVHDLAELVQEQKRAETQRIRDKTARSHNDWGRYNEAEKHVKQMVAGAYRFVEGYQLEDVVLEPIDLDDGITTGALLAYMQEHNLTFAKADANGQAAYNLIFEMMVRYYVDLCSLESSGNDLQMMKAEEKQLQQIALGERMSTFQLGQVLMSGVKSARSAF